MTDTRAERPTRLVCRRSMWVQAGLRLLLGSVLFHMGFQIAYGEATVTVRPVDHCNNFFAVVWVDEVDHLLELGPSKMLNVIKKPS